MSVAALYRKLQLKDLSVSTYTSISTTILCKKWLLHGNSFHISMHNKNVDPLLLIFSASFDATDRMKNLLKLDQAAKEVMNTISRMVSGIRYAVVGARDMMFSLYQRLK